MLRTCRRLHQNKLNPNSFAPGQARLARQVLREFDKALAGSSRYSPAREARVASAGKLRFEEQPVVPCHARRTLAAGDSNSGLHFETESRQIMFRAGKTQAKCFS
jgi:hypothetical protein